MTTSNSATSPRTSIKILRPNLRSKNPANSRMSSRSPPTLPGASGRWTLTATASPLRSTARCTCPMLAEPKGSGSNEANTSSTDAPSSSSMIPCATPVGMGVAVSCSFWSSESTPSGRMSERVERTCPNLTKVGPRSSRVRRNLTPKLGARNSCRPFFSLLSRLTSKTKPKPWRTRTRLIWEKRLRFPDRAAREIPPFATRGSFCYSPGGVSGASPRSGAVHHVVDHRAALFALHATLLDERVHDLLHLVPCRNSGAYLQQDQTLQRLANRSAHNYLQSSGFTSYMITKAQAVRPRR